MHHAIVGAVMREAPVFIFGKLFLMHDSVFIVFALEV